MNSFMIWIEESKAVGPVDIKRSHSLSLDGVLSEMKARFIVDAHLAVDWDISWTPIRWCGCIEDTTPRRFLQSWLRHITAINLSTARNKSNAHMCDQNSCMHAKCQNQINQFLSLGFMVLTGMHVLYHKFELWCLLWILYISGQAWLMLTGHGYFYLLFVYFILLTFQKFSRLRNV